MIKAIRRKSLRKHLCGTDVGSAIKHLKDKVVVVWWYERFHKNEDAQSIPYVDVVFRYLGKRDVPAGSTVVKIAVSHLGSFRVGTIWKNCKCIGETDFGKKEEFSINFSFNSWKYVYLTDHPSTEHELAKFQFDAPRDNSHLPKALSQMLSFELPDKKNLLIPCTEFLVRCYGSTSDMARILATYSWEKVKAILYAGGPETGTDTWVVRPSRQIPDDDALFLASVLYDPYAETSAKSIYAQLDAARDKKINRVSLQVRPWFQGPAGVECIGRWINSNTTFLCLEVTGMTEPRHHPYEVIRPNYTKLDTENGDIVTIPVQPIHEIPKQLDPFVVTAEEEPDKDAFVWSKRDPGFRVMGERCPCIKTTEDLLFSEKKVIAVSSREPSKFSTGDGHGSGKDIGGVRYTSERFIGNGGILKEVWDELSRLEKAREDFSDLAWYAETTGFISDDCEFQLKSLASFDPKSSPSDQARRWLRYPDNTPAVRAALILRIVVAKRSFYLFELQRKKIRKNKTVLEEQISGLLVEISNGKEVVPVIESICDKIRFRRGKFSGLSVIASYPHCIFRHYWKGGSFLVNTTLSAAFRGLDVKL